MMFVTRGTPPGLSYSVLGVPNPAGAKNAQHGFCRVAPKPPGASQWVRERVFHYGEVPPPAGFVTVTLAVPALAISLAEILTVMVVLFTKVR